VPRVTRRGPDGPPMRYEDIRKPVSAEEAQTAECPACGAMAGQPCTYMTDVRRWSGTYWEHPRGATPPLVHSAGSPRPSAHPERNEAIRERRRKQYQADRLRTRPPVNPVSERARQARAAMLAWDAAEYAALTAWWREHGHIITDAAATRPDGSVRGRGYGLIDAERETDRAFEP
jgi:hypothetical protein